MLASDLLLSLQTKSVVHLQQFRQQQIKAADKDFPTGLIRAQLSWQGIPIAPMEIWQGSTLPTLFDLSKLDLFRGDQDQVACTS